MVKIDNKEDNDPSTNPNNNPNNNHNNDKTERYTIDKNELTFPIDGLKNAKIVNESSEAARQSSHDIPSGNTEAQFVNKNNQVVPTKKTPEQLKAEQLERMAYEDKDLKFIHLPDDPAYKPISLELIKMNEFQNEDLKLNTRIMMNIALSDYVVFRQLNDDGDVEENVKVYFRRVKTNEFQEYVDLQTALDDLVKRVGIIEMTYPPTMELQDKLYDYQKKLIAVARQRVRKGYDIFFKWESQEFRNNMFNEFDNNDITFNVDCAFVRLTKSPFLRRKSSPTF
jgi:hypothetical protein